MCVYFVMKFDADEIAAMEEGMAEGLEKIIPGVKVKIILPEGY